MKSQQSITQRAQRGMASMLAVMFLVSVVVFVLAQTISINSTSSLDNQRQLDSTAALFLAESGIESAQSELRIAAIAGTYTNATCTGLNGKSTALGRGSYQYTPTPVSVPALCGGVNPSCNSCTLTVKGSVGSTSRSVQAVLTALPSNGVEGQTNSGNQAVNGTPNFTLNLSALQNNSYAFTHLAWNPVSNWGGSAVSSICQSGSTGREITSCKDPSVLNGHWLLDGLYYNNTASQGVLAPVPLAGTYSITTSLNDNLSSDKRRNYAMVGLIFSPVNRSGGGSVTATGSYAQKLTACNASLPRTQPLTAAFSSGNSTGPSCSPSDYQTGKLHSNWTCNPNSETTAATWANAAQSDTLLVGFGGKPYRASGNCTATPRPVTGLSLNGQSFTKGVELIGTQCDQTYSQIWYAYNPAYSTTNSAHNGAAFEGSIGSTFTGSMGATFTGYISTAGKEDILTVTAISSGSLNIDDTISGTSVPNNTTITKQSSGTTGLTGTYVLSSNIKKDVSSRSMTAASNVLVVGSAPASGVISVGDIITSTGSGTNVAASTTISSQSSGSTGLAGSYSVSGSGSAQTVSSRSMTASSTVLRLVTPPTNPALDSGNSFTITDGSGATSYGTVGSNSKLSPTTYQLSGATTRQVSTGNMIAFNGDYGSTQITLTVSDTVAPAEGTALGVISGTGQFKPISCTSGGIDTSDTTYTTLKVSGCSKALSVGDAISGPYLLPNTKIVSQITWTPTGGKGSYTVSPPQTTQAAGPIVARAAVRGPATGMPKPTANSFTVSRLPDTAPLKGAMLCGGLCPLLLSDGTNPVGQFRLTGIQNYDDWSAGFTCLSGVDPDTIKPLGTVLAKRTGWSEPAR